LNVCQFGAVGDGETDDTRAIQDAIDAAAAISGQVIFPPGVYAYSTLDLKPHVTLKGCATSWSHFRFSYLTLLKN
jgi:polygalacturonase